MNASDIIKAKQNRVLYQAYYRPTIFSTLINSSITSYPISTISTGSGIISSIGFCSTVNYLSRCTPTSISYELSNSVNDGKYICGFPYCSTISEWNSGETFVSGVCDCKISKLNWVNTNLTNINFYSTSTYSSIVSSSATILTGPGPMICPLINFYQGTNFDNNCDTCNVSNGNNNCCN